MIFISMSQVFVEWLSIWDLSRVFLLVKLGLWVWRGRSQDKVPFYHIISKLHAIDIIYDHWCWPWHCAFYLLFNVILSKVENFNYYHKLYSLYSAISLLNANTWVLDSYAKSPKLHNSHFVAHTCVFIYFLTEQWKCCTKHTQLFLCYFLVHAHVHILHM